MKLKRIFITLFVFLICAGGTAVIAFWPRSVKNTQARHNTRIIIPNAPGGENMETSWTELMAYEESVSMKVPLADGEIAVSVLNIDINFDAIEEQIVAFRNQSDSTSQVSLTLIAYDERLRTYRRMWTMPTAVTMPGTLSLYTQDLLGDRSICVIVTGMNIDGEHTLMVFHKDPQADFSLPFTAIAEIQMDGSINVQETERPLAYRQGIAKGQAFAITAYGRDTESDNILDRTEITYVYNPVQGIFGQSAVIRVPGSQIEQRRLKEILTGEPKVFESFINDLWYYVSPRGTIEKSQYLYFDPEKREIIFFGDETQQVFAWQHSTSTRYGLYISSQNISVTTLRRFLDIELESLDSIRMRVFEDVKLKIGVSASWDGSYRRAAAAMKTSPEEKTVQPYTEAVYDSSMGRLRFYGNGEYELSSSGTIIKGRYAFFLAGNSELLELRPERNGSSDNGENHQIYLIINAEKTDNESTSVTENLILSKVRLGSGGVHDLHESQIILTPVQ